jgi:hypothetical protein
MARTSSRISSRSKRRQGKPRRSVSRTKSVRRLSNHDQTSPTVLVSRRPEQEQLSAATTQENSDSRILEKLHPELLGGAAYLRLSKQFGSERLQTAGPAALTFQEEMHPKDPLEGLALSQALLAHARAAWLTKLLTSQTNPDSFRIISEACERAAGTFQRLVQAIAEYRRPAGSTKTLKEAPEDGARSLDGSGRMSNG